MQTSWRPCAIPPSCTACARTTGRACARSRARGSRPGRRPPNRLPDAAAGRHARRPRHPWRPRGDLATLGGRRTTQAPIDSGHHQAEQAPDELAQALREFLAAPTRSRNAVFRASESQTSAQRRLDHSSSSDRTSRKRPIQQSAHARWPREHTCRNARRAVKAGHSRPHCEGLASRQLRGLGQRGACRVVAKHRAKAEVRSDGDWLLGRWAHLNEGEVQAPSTSFSRGSRVREPGRAPES